jgi:hypothetical protein
MALRIEAPETMRMIEELAQRTGESSEQVIEIAIRERLDRVRSVEARVARKAELQELVDRLASRFEEPCRSLDPGEWLYGEDGLPR